jgi:hypothetical protein
LVTTINMLILLRKYSRTRTNTQVRVAYNASGLVSEYSRKNRMCDASHWRVK